MALFGVVLSFLRCKYPQATRNLLILTTLFSGMLLARAQTLPDVSAVDQNGLQPYASYHGGDIDAVGLTNGTLTLDFPFLSYPQRGKLSAAFNLKYNNIPQHYGELCISPDPCYLAWGYPTQPADPFSKVLGNVHVAWAQGAGVVGQVRTLVVNPGKSDQFTEFFSNWFVQTADGSKHVLGNQGTDSWNVQGNNYLQVSSGPFETLDATGWKVIGSLTPPYVTGDAANQDQPSTTAPTAIVSPDGIRYSGGQIEDPNGNLITSTDSLGRQMPFPPSNPSTGNASTTGCTGPLATAFAVLWTPPAYQGGTANYKFCYA